ncbi:cytidine deaminase-like [Ylistrum balloti]|uniref:cytidine deaminase-like n=1 Tax=Ylistrum balloti TaxID=509963 RepID=UPI002905A09B|nr:cytidine deaminase-like [Ylistrum balloti]
MNLNTFDTEIQSLVSAAVEAKDRAYCPYSNFRVGSAVLCADGSIVTGVNVENASYGLSVCAERVAVWNAVAQGHKDFKGVAISCDVKGDFKGSCGACRQVFAEFNLDMPLYLAKPDKTIKVVTVSELLPMSFTPKTLQEERI